MDNIKERPVKTRYFNRYIFSMLNMLKNLIDSIDWYNFSQWSN